MKTDTTNLAAGVAEGDVLFGENCFDPLEAGVRTCLRGFIEGLLEAELDAALARKRYERPSLAETETVAKVPGAAGHRHGHRARQLMGTFGPVTVRAPGPVWKRRTARRPSGRTRRSRLISGAPNRPMP